MGLATEFKEFASKGSVVDLAVGSNDSVVLAPPPRRPCRTVTQCRAEARSLGSY